MSLRGKNVIRLFAQNESDSWVFPVLYEDDHFLALDKMTHMAVTHSQLFPERPSLFELIRLAIDSKARWVEKRNINYLGFAYRLDFETSGISLLQIQRGSPADRGPAWGQSGKREFLCLVHGSPQEETFEVDAKIGWVTGEPEIMVAGKRGKFASTKFEVVERLAGFTLLRCLPSTDRKHQIRASATYRFAFSWGCVLRRQFVDVVPIEEKLSPPA